MPLIWISITLFSVFNKNDRSIIFCDVVIYLSIFGNEYHSHLRNKPNSELLRNITIRHGRKTSKDLCSSIGKISPGAGDLEGSNHYTAHDIFSKWIGLSNNGFYSTLPQYFCNIRSAAIIKNLYTEIASYSFQ